MTWNVSHRDLLLDRIEEADELLVATVLHVAADDGAIEKADGSEQRGCSDVRRATRPTKSLSSFGELRVRRQLERADAIGANWWASRIRCTIAGSSRVTTSTGPWVSSRGAVEREVDKLSVDVGRIGCAMLSVTSALSPPRYPSRALRTQAADQGRRGQAADTEAADADF